VPRLRASWAVFRQTPPEQAVFNYMLVEDMLQTPVTYVDNGYGGFYPTCPQGAVPGSDSQCYQVLGYPEQVMSGGVMTLSFRQATNIINVYEQWDNQCAGLEARAQ
jgi:hypothetical protein